MVLLDQQVNSLGLTTLEQKLKAIQLLTYPSTLEALEHYLGLTSYLRSYIHFYAQLATPLQSLKPVFLQEVLPGRQHQRAYMSKIKSDPSTPSELAFFLNI